MANTPTPPNPTPSAQDAKWQAQGPVSSAMDAVKGAASATLEKAREFGSAIGRRADDAAGYVGSGVRSMGQSIERGGRYLEERHLHGMAEDFTNLVRRNPVASLLIGVGVGYLISRAIWR